MKINLLAALAVMSVAAPALADDVAPSPFTGNIAFTTDYVFRGMSQSNEEPTIQGGIDWNDAATGLYAGTWASGVDFTDATTEMDFYGGVKGAWDNGASWNLGAIYYYYPGADDNRNYDFWELAASVGYDFKVMQATASLNYSPNYFADSGDAWYPALNVNVPLPKGFTANAGVGYQWVSDNTAFGYKDYSTWSLGLGYDVYGFNLGLKYIDTSLSEPAECADGCSERVVLTVAKAF